MDGIRNTVVRMTLHTGTHVDAPWHIVEDGLTIDRVDLDRLMRPAVRLDLRRVARPSTPVTVGDLDACGFDPAELAGRIVVLHCGWTDEHVGTPRLYGENPFLSAEATEAIVGAGPTAIGLDFAIDEAKPWPNHQVALGAGIPLIENLVGLGRLPRSGFVLAAFPVKVAGGDGAPVRAVALVE